MPAMKTFDVDEFFREQKERMDVSDEDWEEYEHRMHQENRKRKQAQREEAVEDSEVYGSDTNEINDPAHEEEAWFSKKRKLSEDSVASHAPQNAVLPPLGSTTKEGIDIAVSSKLSQAGPSVRPRKLPPRSPAHISAMSSLSNVTTPAETPLKYVGTDSAVPHRGSGTETSKPAARSKSLPDARRRRQTAAEDKEHERLAKKAAQQAKRDAEKAKKSQQDKEARMTPLEYAAILQEKWKARITSTPSEKLFLKDKVVFLVPEEQGKSSKDTRIKLDIIAKNGGTVATKYDPNVVTHVIPGGGSITMKKTLRALGLKSLSEIPSTVKTVKWDWIISGLSKSTPDSEIVHESFKQRVAYMYLSRTTRDSSKEKGKGKQSSLSVNDESVIEEFNSVYDSPNEGDEDVPAKPRAGGSGHKSNPAQNAASAEEQAEDPLLPFYAKAREEAEGVGFEDDLFIPAPEQNEHPKASKYKGFQCDKKGTHLQSTSPNWDIIEKLAELREIYRDNGTKDDMWRVLGYQKAIGSLKAHPTRIKSREEAMKLAGVSDKTADKIMEIINTGELRRIEYTKTADLAAMRIFSGIYGVGPTTARKWYNQGFKSLSDLRNAVGDGKFTLSAAQETGLKFYDDINDRMPRNEAQAIFEKIKPLALALDSKLSLEIMGSFRRGKETCGDIDILLTRPTDDGKTHEGILRRLWTVLHKHGILTEDLAIPEVWGALEATYRGLCRKDGTSRRRRIDILCIPYESRGAARLYYTGDDIFNRSIRLKANKMDMSLNQRGLFESVVRDPQDRRKKTCTGTLLCSHSEKRIFEILGVPWQEPYERVRGG